MTLFNLLQQSAEKFPKSPALYFKEQIWDYQTLVLTVLRTAKGLELAGIGEGDRVALLMKNSPEFIVTVFALARIGAISVPMNFFLKSEEAAYILQHSQAKGMVTQSAFIPVVKQASSLGSLKNIWVTDLEKDSADSSFKPFQNLAKNSGEPRSFSDSKKTVLILYTSGTTGKPKGVLLSHDNLASNAESSIQAMELTHKDKFICLLPMFHVFALTTNVVIPIRLGCPILVVESIRPPKPWLKLLSKHKITVFAAVPQIYSVLADQAKGFKRLFLKYLFFRSVRFCISGAAPLPQETQEVFEKRIGKPLLEGYGLSETSPVVTVSTPKFRKKGSCGKTIPGVQVKIIDENEKALPINQEGEICISGHCVMQGYYKEEQATRNTMTKDGWFKTGDIGLMDSEGFLFIRDRIKDMIIVKGLKVFSVQVEDVLLSDARVAEAAVVGVPAPSGDEFVKAFVVLKENETLEKQELMKLCQEKLPTYKWPRDIEIRKELPKNALQKILKRELRKQAMEQQGG